MAYKNFNELKDYILKNGKKINCVVVSAHEEHTILAVIRAYNDSIINPILVGNKKKIIEILKDNNFDYKKIEILDAKDDDGSMSIAIEMIKSHRAECIMKGIIKTDKFMSALFKKENDLRKSKQVSMLSFREIPNYHKLLAFTDTGICPHPTLQQKKDIIQNSVEIMNKMGIRNPKVAVLAAVEAPNDKMPESLDGYELKKMCENGEITECIVEGPISLDLALSKEAANIKGYKSEVAGDADLLLFPDLASANVTTKMIAQITQEPAGVLVLGTRVPAIVCSRSATVETKYLCITLAAAGGLG